MFFETVKLSDERILKNKTYKEFKGENLCLLIKIKQIQIKSLKFKDGFSVRYNKGCIEKNIKCNCIRGLLQPS